MSRELVLGGTVRALLWMLIGTVIVVSGAADAQLWREVLDQRNVAAPPLAERTPGELPRADPGVELGLAEVVALALAHNPALKAVEERRWEVVGGVRESRAEAFPQLTAISDWGRSRNPSLLNSADFADFVDQFPGGDFVPREQELYRVSVEVTQPLYTWGRVGTAIRLARTLVDVTDEQIRTVRLDTGLVAAQAYYQLLALRRALITVESQRQVREESLAVVQARYDLGEATRLELLRGQASLAQVEPEVATIRGDVLVAESRLRQVLGLSSFGGNSAPDGTGRLRLREAVLDPPTPPALEEVLAAGRRARPELRDLELQQRALEQQKTVVASGGKPSLELSGAYGHSARLVENLDDPLFRDWSLTVGLSWDLFDGGRRKGQLARLDSQRLQLAWQQRDLELSLRVEVEQALAAYQAACARWQAAEISAQAAREARRVARESYQEGVALQSDLLDAQQQETDAELVLVQAYYSALSAWARLHRAAGHLPVDAWPAENRQAESSTAPEGNS